MRTYYPFGNREAQAAIITLCACVRGINAVETLKNMWQMLCCNTNPGILHTQPGLPILYTGRERHAATSTCVGDRVIQQIHGHLDQTGFVAEGCHSFVCLYMQCNVFLVR